MSNDEKAIIEASRQLTALEGAVHGILVEANAGKMDPTMATVKETILASLWQDGNAVLLRFEALTGPNQRRRTFCEAFAKAKCALMKLRQGEGTIAASLDVTRATAEECAPNVRETFLGHLRQLFDMPKLTTASAVDLMRVIDVVETSVASAKQVAGVPDQRTTVIEDGLLVSIVLSKLDKRTIERASLRLNADVPTWKELREELDRLANQLYRESKNTQVMRAPTSSAPTRPTRTAAPQSGNARKALDCHAGTRRCYACDRSGHVGEMCPELRVRSVCERVKFIKGKGKCVNCLSNQHAVTQCPSEKRCKICNMLHHTKLHMESVVNV
ncbi:uncharacterized protein LOC125763104 [Anopheles funestus]|uniref:uncharacterized protein LOC125763104 n=1 Tax=Anopheles funestus TaxID=62324 RepID=UPI0020C6323A|nr:uncharacterized protein LOC125763104 [Anopheles funestus]